MVIFTALRGLLTSRLTKRSCFSLFGIVGLIGPGFGLAHATTLTDLGYPNGLTLSGQSPSQTIYFPLPVASNGATLNLRYAPSAALDPHSSVTIAVNGVPIDTTTWQQLIDVARKVRLNDTEIPHTAAV